MTSEGPVECRWHLIFTLNLAPYQSRQDLKYVQVLHVIKGRQRPVMHKLARGLEPAANEPLFLIFLDVEEFKKY